MGRGFKMRITAAALRSVDHRGGLDAFLLKAKDSELSDNALKIKKEEGVAGQCAPSDLLRGWDDGRKRRRRRAAGARRAGGAPADTLYK